MHASCESPCHLSAKHCLLRACFPRTAPFRAMLLTARGGPRCLGSRAYEVPVYLIAFLHSYFALSRRTVSLSLDIPLHAQEAGQAAPTPKVYPPDAFVQIRPDGKILITVNR